MHGERPASSSPPRLASIVDPWSRVRIPGRSSTCTRTSSPASTTDRWTTARPMPCWTRSPRRARRRSSRHRTSTRASTARPTTSPRACARCAIAAPRLPMCSRAPRCIRAGSTTCSRQEPHASRSAAAARCSSRPRPTSPERCWSTACGASSTPACARCSRTQSARAHSRTTTGSHATSWRAGPGCRSTRARSARAPERAASSPGSSSTRDS